MTVIATSGIFGYGVQTQKGQLAATWYRHRSEDIDLGAAQQIQTIPLEVGGVIVPTGAYKSGAFVAGGASINPRMEGDLGWLLKGLLGTVDTQLAIVDDDYVLAEHTLDGSTVNTGITDPPASAKVVLTVYLPSTGGAVNIVVNGPAGVPTESFSLSGLPAGRNILRGSTSFTDVNNIVLPTVAGGKVKVGYLDGTAKDHIFKMDTDQASLPWLSVRKYIPGSLSTNDLGEIGMDCRMLSAAFTFPNNGIIKSRLDFLGRVPTLAHDPSWTWADTYESFESIPLTCNVDGGITLPKFSTTPLPMTSLQVQFQNQLTQPQQEQIIGSPYPDDIAVVSRAMSLKAVLKWNDPDLYSKILNNSITATDWSDVVYTTDFDAVVKAPFAPTGASAKYGLRIRAGNVAWSADGSPRLAAGGAVMLPITGNVLDPVTGVNFAEFILTNAQASY